MIYEPLVKSGYEWINAIDAADYEKFLSFDGTSRVDSWKAIPVRRVRADDRQDCRESDFPWLGSHALVLREKAVRALRQLISPFAEILPLETDDGTKLSVLNVLCVVNALDEERSAIERFGSSNRIMRVTRPHFRLEAIHGLAMFRLPFRASPTYLSREFVDAVSGARLVGLEFRPVWPPAAAA
jgi:hypothetical protein